MIDIANDSHVRAKRFRVLLRRSQAVSGFAAVGLLLAACSTSSTISHDYGQWRETVHREFVAPSMPQRGVQSDGAVAIDSMSSALQIAAARDADLARQRQRVKEEGIGTEAADSLSWPRLGLEASIDFPLRDNNNSVTGNGGLFLRYNLSEAIFRKDAQSAAQLRLRLAQQRYRGRMLGLYWELREGLVGYACAKQRRVNAEGAREVATRAYTTAKRLAETKSGNGAIRNRWESRVLELTANADEAGLRLLLARERLRTYLGKSDFSVFAGRVLEEDPVLDGRRLTTMPDAQILEQAWRANPRLREADLSAQLAEYDVLRAQRGQLPKFSLRLGYGDIDVGTDENSHLVAGVGIDFPLLDIGDNRRLVEKAKAKRIRAREELKAAARGLASALRENRTKIDIANVRLHRVDIARRHAKTRLEMLRSLRLHGRLGSFELAEGELDWYAQDSKYCERRADLIKAIADFNLTWGSVPDDARILPEREQAR